MHHHRREHFALLEGVRNLFPFADAGARFQHRIGHDRIPHDAGDRLHRLQNRHARSQQRAHRAAETRHHDFMVERSEHGHAQLDPIRHAPPHARADEEPVRNKHHHYRDNHDVPFLGEERAEVNQELGGGRHFFDAQLLEEVRELRDQPRDQENHDSDRGEQHDYGIGQGGADFASQLHILLKERRDTLERLFQHAADLPSADQTDNQLAERFGVACHRAGEALTRLDARGKVYQDFAQAGVVRLLL